MSHENKNQAEIIGYLFGELNFRYKNLLLNDSYFFSGEIHGKSKHP
jgi:hypothetical protein